MTWLVALGWARKILTFCIPVPVFIILAAIGYVHFYSIPSAIKQFVAGAELQASQAELVAMKKIADAANARAENADRATLQLANRMAEQRTQDQSLQNEIDQLKKRPVSPDCSVGPLFDQLRNR